MLYRCMQAHFRCQDASIGTSMPASGAFLTFEPISAETRTALWFVLRPHPENAHSGVENCPEFGPEKRSEFSVASSLFERGICLNP